LDMTAMANEKLRRCSFIILYYYTRRWSLRDKKKEEGSVLVRLVQDDPRF